MTDCPECGEPLVAASRSCHHCGAVLVDVPTGERAAAGAQSRGDVSILGARLAAGAIDLVPLLALAFFDYWFQRRGIRLGRVVGRVLLVLPVIIVLLRDSVAGLSPGKLMMGLRARDRQTGEPAGIPDSILRNLPLVVMILSPLARRWAPHIALGIAAIQVLLIVVNRRGLTDLIGGTEVTRR